jgi:hypothetical protein
MATYSEWKSSFLFDAPHHVLKESKSLITSADN